MLALPLILALSLNAAGPRITYVALGDSTGVGVGARRGSGYPARLVAREARAGRALRLVNLCVSGARVADVRARQLPRMVAAAPAVVTLAVGINDVTLGTDLAAFARDYEAVAAALARSGAPVVAVNVLDLSRSPLAQGEDAQRAIRARVLAVNARIAAAARRHGFALVDLFAATEGELGLRPELLAADRFHPSDLGYERWTDAMQPDFERALARAAAAGGAALSGGPALR